MVVGFFPFEIYLLDVFLHGEHHHFSLFLIDGLLLIFFVDKVGQFKPEVLTAQKALGVVLLEKEGQQVFQALALDPFLMMGAALGRTAGGNKSVHILKQQALAAVLGCRGGELENEVEMVVSVFLSAPVSGCPFRKIAL